MTGIYPATYDLKSSSDSRTPWMRDEKKAMAAVGSTMTAVGVIIAIGVFIPVVGIGFAAVGGLFAFTGALLAGTAGYDHLMEQFDKLTNAKIENTSRVAASATTTNEISKSSPARAAPVRFSCAQVKSKTPVQESEKSSLTSKP